MGTFTLSGSKKNKSSLCADFIKICYVHLVFEAVMWKLVERSSLFI